MLLLCFTIIKNNNKKYFAVKFQLLFSISLLSIHQNIKQNFAATSCSAKDTTSKIAILNYYPTFNSRDVQVQWGDDDGVFFNLPSPSSVIKLITLLPNCTETCCQSLFHLKFTMRKQKRHPLIISTFTAQVESASLIVQYRSKGEQIFLSRGRC